MIEANLVVRRENAQSFCNLVRGSSATHVEEVGRVAAVELDDVHGSHSEASSVDWLCEVGIREHAGDRGLLSSKPSWIIHAKAPILFTLKQQERTDSIHVRNVPMHPMLPSRPM